MTARFPPAPVFPIAIDNDYTLFLVNNTTETTLSEDNQPWADEIVINPRSADEIEIWADNGFATISGELFYYDDVEKNGDDRVIKLRGCARNLGGKQTQINLAGTDVRAFVIAEHHNQLVDAIIAIEDFIGIIDSDDANSLDFRIRQLLDQPDCIDDNNCPNVSFDFQIESDNPCDGTIIDYQLDITGDFSSFQLNFGDGNSTTSTQSGTHLYAPNANIDPVVLIANTRCQLIITPVDRVAGTEPQANINTTALVVPIPEAPDFPTIDLPTISVPPTDIQIPPIVMPCIDLEPFGSISIGDISIGDIPSVISFTSLDIPSLISITPLSFPSLISVTPLSFPSVITITAPTLPSTISIIAPTIPSEISITGISNISFSLPSEILFSASLPSIITVIDHIPTTIVVVDNLPSTISIITPSIPRTISIVGNIPTGISIVGNIPSNISITGQIPSTISFTGHIPSNISVTGHIPSNISVTGHIPSHISITGHIPSQISIAGCSIPSHISITGNIPSHISVTGNIPTHISVTAPNLPGISVTWGSAPSIHVDWGSAPTINVACTCACCPSSTSMTQFAGPMFEEENTDAAMGTLNVDYDFAGIPSRIMLEVPEIPAIRLAYDDLPPEINVRGLDIPDRISFVNAESIPAEIRVINVDIPSSITIDASSLPKSISLDATNLPQFIMVKNLDIPSVISVESNIPSQIEVIGIPKTILVEGFPTSLKVDPIELVYKGAPIEMVVKLDLQNVAGTTEEGHQCVMIVPCKN